MIQTRSDVMHSKGGVPTDQESNSVARNKLTSLSIETEEEDRSSRCASLRSCFQKYTHPCLAESHPLDSSSTMCQKFLHNFFCPPHSRMGAIIFVILLTGTAWATLFSLTGQHALPGGNLFSLLVIFIACWCGGYLAGLLRLPPLLGMLIVGGILGNAPHINVGQDIYQTWSGGCRQIALTIILIRAGLGLDPSALRRLSFVVLRLAFLPCLAETLVDGIASHLILGFPWPWGFMLGFVIAAVSPAVVVPSLLSLADQGYGVDKGIPTLVIAAASVDDVLAITGFGVLLGISFSTGDIVWTLFKGPLEALVGVAYGVICGVVLWYIPQRTSKRLLLFRSIFMLCLGLMAILGSIKLDWSGAGPLGVLTLSFVAALRWRQEFQEDKQNPIEDVVGLLWLVFQPLLFGLIGAEVDISSIDGETVGLGIAVLAIGLFVRMVVSFLAVLGTNLSLQERLFIPIAWLPKATVQAAIGAVALDAAKEKADNHLENLGQQVLTLAVVSILLTAPLGSLLIAVLGRFFLKQPPGYRLSVHVASPDEQHHLEDSDMRHDSQGE